MNKADLDHILDLEMTKNEYQRLKIFAVILGFAFLLSLVNSQFYRQGATDVFGENLSYKWIILWAIAYLILCLISLMFVRNKAVNKKVLSQKYVLISVIVESILPGFLLFGFSYQIESPVFLDSPVVFFYFPIIIVSSLHLKFRYSLLTGLIAGGSYLLLIYWVFDQFGDHPSHRILLPTSVYYTRGFILIVSGICAGLVAILLKSKLTKSLEYMSERNVLEGLFSQQVSSKVMETLTKEKNLTKRMQATIVFLDIRDFSRFAQTKTPEQVINFQNQFFAPIIQIVTDYDGVVNQILGDGLMISFGAPTEDTSHAKAAFRACMDIFRFVSSEPDVGYDSGKLRIGIGVHSGMVVTGNIGNESRKQFSISGTPIIIASRLEQLNKTHGSQFLVSGQFLEFLRQENLQVKQHGHTKLKGIDEEIEVIEIVI